MNIHSVETLMADLSELFMAPVILLIVGLFIFALFALGRFSSQAMVRKKNRAEYLISIKNQQKKTMQGYPLHNFYIKNPGASEDELEVFALKKLEALRIVTRVAPMLGLIATMIPMGPALQALADGNIQGISENLIIAFAAVIWGLIIATLTFWPATVKKRWLAAELINIRKLQEKA